MKILNLRPSAFDCLAAVGVMLLTAVLCARVFSANAAPEVASAPAAHLPAAAASKPKSAASPLIVKPAILPFWVAPVQNADTEAPTTAMPLSASQLDQIRGYMPKSVADSTSPEQYQSEVEIKARDDYERERGEKIAKIIRGNPNSRLIALTFDDGPHAKFTLQLLAELKALHVPATFFIVGKQAVKFPTLVQLEVIEGNEVGNHTYDHLNLTKIPPSLVPYELDECDAVIRHIIGTSPRFFRPPGGDYDTDVIKAAAAHGYITTLWTDDPGDFKHLPSDVILQRCLSKLSPGAIVLLHDGIPETMQMLPQFVAEARSQGYEFVTMSELADDMPLTRPTPHLASSRRTLPQ